MTLKNALGDISTEATLVDARDRLIAIAAELADHQTDALTNTQLRGAPVAVTVSNPTTAPETGLAKDTTLSNVLSALSSKLAEGGTVVLDATTLAALESVTATVSNFPAEFPLSAAQIATLTPQTDALTDTELRATPVPVSGTVTMANPTADPQTDALTDTELRATPVPVSGTVTVANPDGAPQTDALTNTELRAVPVPVSGTVTVANPTGDPQTDALTDTELRAAPVSVLGPVTDTELRATPVPVSGTVDVASTADMVLMDYVGTSGGPKDPKYVGIALQGSATTAAVWTIIKLEFDSLNRLIDKQEFRDAIWDDRATLGWVV